MGTWFDKLAKHSAEGSVDGSAEASDGLTRRQVLARGAVVTGAAWTAPMLLSATPAWAVTSCPKKGEVPTACPGGAESICCPEGQGCFQTGTGHNLSYSCDLVVGAVCNNNGFGTCNGGASTCNQACNTGRTPVCGGAGSTCRTAADCAEGRNCSPTGFCGGIGAACSASSPCSPGSCNSNNVATVCVAGLCV